MMKVQENSITEEMADVCKMDAKEIRFFLDKMAQVEFYLQNHLIIILWGTAQKLMQ